MESKRKASSGMNGHEAGSDTPDRAAKRRKLQEEFGDLSKGETPESTTAYGLHILESIRSTTDKNGRLVSPFFETLPSRSKDPEYYKKIRLPLSLQIIERKLRDGTYPNLSVLESDFKRLVSNAKETNTRQSEAFSDAERVRKAVSNLMVKQNPAYKSGNYQAVATPLPPSPGPDGGEDEDEDEEEDAEGEEDVELNATSDTGANAEADEDDAEGEEEDGEEEGEEEGEEDGDGEEQGENEEDEDEGEEADDGDDDDPKPRRIIRRGRGRRRGPAPGRSARGSVASTQKSTRKATPSAKIRTQSEETGYKGLTFQQAQEKIVEDTIKMSDEAGGYYFEPFVFLPPRTLKDYYEVIAEPLSLKAFQKQVRGQHGREKATYISDFKNWAAFEDQASLIWKNAYHYNEDGSEIFVMAQELEEHFKKLIEEAKQHVPDPPQPKIKLKVPQSSETPAHPKKITIHVGGKTSATGSPAPATAQSGEAEKPRNGTPVLRNPFGGTPSGSLNLGQLDKARSLSASAPSPSPSAVGVVKPEEVARASPAIMPQSGTTTFQQFAPPIMPPSGPVPNVAVPQPPPPPKPTATDIIEAQRYRPYPISESEAILPRLQIVTIHSAQADNRLAFTIPASTIECQQEVTLHVPSTHYRVQIRPMIASFLEPQQREWKLNVLHGTARLYPMPGQYEKRTEPVFDVVLNYGVNRLDVSLVAALPKGEKAPNGLTMEMERFVVHLNLLKHS
ncbi:hypothetical protein SLS62_007956 [Diatrype stigma]|uniref:Bromo domain-containing protein n=1 Tax=Diatrype stigma TaxID=117547 RepID=A0AAN9UMD4_9PEZI